MDLQAFQQKINQSTVHDDFQKRVLLSIVRQSETLIALKQVKDNKTKVFVIVSILEEIEKYLTYVKGNKKFRPDQITNNMIPKIQHYLERKVQRSTESTDVITKNNLEIFSLDDLLYVKDNLNELKTKHVRKDHKYLDCYKRQVRYEFNNEKVDLFISGYKTILKRMIPELFKLNRTEFR